MSFSNTIDQGFLDKFLTDNTTLYLALSTTTPAKDGTNVTEPAGGAYAREDISAVVSRSGSTISNTSDIAFTTATDSWGTITYGAIYSASEAGTMLWFGALTTPKAIGSGSQCTVLTGELDITAA
ncbi:MAG: hypothetical protein WC455_29370 [Dehalococcoidia bacterium]|jgi:hypothetical protein